MPLTTTHFHSNVPHALNAAFAQLVPFSDVDDGCNFEMSGVTLPPSASLDSASFSPDLSAVHSPHVSFSGVTFIREVSSIFERQMHLGIPQHPPGSVPNPFQQRSTRTFSFELGPISPGLPYTQSMGTPTTFSSAHYPMTPTDAMNAFFPSVPVSSSGPMLSPHMNMMHGNPASSSSPALMPSTASWGPRRSPSPAPQPRYLPSLAQAQQLSNSSPAIRDPTPPPIGRTGTVFIPAPTGSATPPPGMGEGMGEEIGYREMGMRGYAHDQYRPSAALRSLSPATRPLSAGVRSWTVRGEHEREVNSAAQLPMVRSELGMTYPNDMNEVFSARNEAPRRASWSAGMMRPGMLAQQNGLYDGSPMEDPMDGAQYAHGRGAWDTRVGEAAGVAAATPLSPSSAGSSTLGSARGVQQYQHAAAPTHNPLQAPNGHNNTTNNDSGDGDHNPHITTRVRTYYRYVDKNGNPLSDVYSEKPRPDQTAAAAAAAMAALRSPPMTNEGGGNVGSVGGSGVGVAVSAGRSRSPAPQQFMRSSMLALPSYEESGLLSNRGPSPGMQRVQTPEPQRALSPPPVAPPGGRGSIAEAVPRPQPRAAVVRRATTTS